MRSIEPGPGGRVIPLRRAQDAPEPLSTDVRLLDRVRVALRTRHYSVRTEKAYVGWIRRFILFHGKRHPETMGELEIGSFLSSLATEARVAASTATAAFLEQFLADTHGHQSASLGGVTESLAWSAIR